MTCLIERRLVKAIRTGEGMEDDWYRCPEGHTFGIDWAYDGPPKEPQWPPSAELVALASEREPD